MIAVPGRAAMLTGRAYQTCHTYQCITRVPDREKKANAVKEKKDKIGRQRLIY